MKYVVYTDSSFLTSICLSWKPAAVVFVHHFTHRLDTAFYLLASMMPFSSR